MPNTDRRTSHLGSDVVTFKVGKNNPESFVVHKRLLIHKVPVFDNFFSSTLGNGVGELVFLPDDKPVVFALFLDWIYTGELCVETGATMKETEGAMTALLELYYFADKHNTRILPDMLMDKILSISRKFNVSPNLQVINDAYAHTKPGSKLRFYLARCFTLYALHDHDALHDQKAAGKDYTPDMLYALTVKHTDLWRDFFHIIGGMRPDSDHPSLMPKCDYHEHGPNVACNVP